MLSVQVAHSSAQVPKPVAAAQAHCWLRLPAVGSDQCLSRWVQKSLGYDPRTYQVSPNWSQLLRVDSWYLSLLGPGCVANPRRRS